MQRPLQRAGHRHAAEFLERRRRLSQPPSSRARIDFLNDSGSVTVWVLGSNTGGLRSAVGERLGDRPSGQSGHLAEHFARGVGVDVGVVTLT